jgi:hypothetical protein
MGSHPSNIPLRSLEINDAERELLRNLFEYHCYSEMKLPGVRYEELGTLLGLPGPLGISPTQCAIVDLDSAAEQNHD